MISIRPPGVVVNVMHCSFRRSQTTTPSKSRSDSSVHDRSRTFYASCYAEEESLHWTAGCSSAYASGTAEYRYETVEVARPEQWLITSVRTPSTLSEQRGGQYMIIIARWIEDQYYVERRHTLPSPRNTTRIDTPKISHYTIIGAKK